MSVVCNVILTGDLRGINDEEENAAVLGIDVPGAQYVQHFAANYDRDAKNWGGGKFPEERIWTGAFNHVDLDALLVEIAKLPWWDDPDWNHCHVFSKHEFDDEWRVFRLVDGKWLEATWK